jgi:hypothetical protein
MHGRCSRPHSSDRRYDVFYSRVRPPRWGLAVVVLVAGALGLAASGNAGAAQSFRTVRYHGYVIRVPSSWPVYDLARDPKVCVRFDRAALYLGAPSSNQRCPAHGAGRHRAILIEPGRGSVRVLHAPRVSRSATRAPLAHPAQAGGGVYTGLGFDACSAPSTSAMSAWASSPYRALGVYIGGANMACSQPNLTTAWVDSETAAGWHLIPTYVGLQAPSNSCGCAAIKASQAQAEGIAAANDAVADAQAVGIGAGNPIYDDMEYYARGGTNTSAVLAFLSGWTSQLHADGYRSGVYGNDDSVISDLVAELGTSYPEPDDIWIAAWNNQHTTTDPYVPSSDWATHQRLHQYDRAHNEKYGGVTINIDGDYIDALTAGAGAIGNSPLNTAPPVIDGGTSYGVTLSVNAGAWAGSSPISFAYHWQRCSSRCTNIAGATGTTYRLSSADIGDRVRVMVRASNYVGHAQVASSEIGPVTPTGYWLFTNAGNVYSSVGTRSFGSPAANHARGPQIVGMAATPDGGGYWLAGASGRMWRFGDAARLGWAPRSQPVVGIAADPTGGYWLFTASGSVYRAGGARWFGSPAANHARRPSIVGMAATPDGGGYWLVGASGRIWAFGDAARLGWTRRSQPVVGIAADPTGGYWLFTASGSVYRAGGARWFGSPAANHARRPSIVGMAATPDGGGYWLVGASGRVWAYGDAARLPPLRHSRPIVGIAGP